jgi:beta-galactosidase
MAVREPNNYRGEIKGTQWSVWPTWESWNWAGWEGKPIEVEVYTKQPEVSLYLNDQLVETKKVGRDTEFKARFTLPYQPGTLRAVAAGEETTLKTAGKPAALRLKADRTVMAADGQDLSYVTLEVVDEHGLVVPDAAIDCEVALKGQGRLMGVVSADLKDTEPATSPRVKTWKGRAIMVVRSSQKRGSIGLTVKSQLPTATLQLSCK